MLLKLSLTAPAPKDPKLRREITEIGTSLEGDYGKSKYCRKPEECLDITAIERIMSTSRDPNELKDLWIGWHAIAPPMRSVMRAFVELSNQGAKEIGFKDTGCDVAIQLRHEAGSIQRGHGTFVEPGATAVPRRSIRMSGQNWLKSMVAECGAARWPNSCAPA